MEGVIMRRSVPVKWAPIVLVVSVLGLTSGLASAQQTTTEVKQFQVISVEGNTVVARTAEGTKEYTVPESFRFMVDGKEVSVHELKPGMKGTATITTTTTVKPVTVTEVRNGEVVRGGGGSILVRGPKGFHSFTQADVDSRNVKIYRDGKPIQISELQTGDRLTATIVTEKPPQILTEREVKATVQGAAPAAAPSVERAPTPAEPAATAPAPGAATPSPAPARSLPRTAGLLPLVGLIGAASLALGAGLTWRRRRASR
jgi:hypothetical protein